MNSAERTLDKILQDHYGVPANAFHTSFPAGNTQAEIVLAAPGSGYRHRIKTLVWSYDGDPTGGQLTILDNASTVFQVDITTGGPGFLPLNRIFGAASPVTIRLAAGGAGISGKLNVESELV